MPQVFHDVACPACGCICDDTTLTVDANRITQATGGCALSKQWFLDQVAEVDEPVQADGAPATREQGIQRAADILKGSRAPLICGLTNSSTPGHRAAVELAEALGATLDPATSPLAAATIAALQSVGLSTATLGEIRNRADLVIYWGSDPLTTHRCHFDRFVKAPGMFVPRGRKGRRLIVVDSRRTATGAIADQFIQLEPSDEFNFIQSLRAALRGLPSEATELAEHLKSCCYGAIFFGPGVAGENVAELSRLVTELNAHTRFVALPMRSAGATQALTWLTGYPSAINFAHGHPRYGPDEFTAELLLERGEVDAVVLMGTAGVARLSAGARQSLSNLPVIVVRNPGDDPLQSAVVEFVTAIYGVHRTGTAYRLDGVPLPLRKILDSPLPSDAEILDSIRQECAHALATA